MEQRKPRRLIKRRAVQQIAPWSTSKLYDKITQGEFPKPVPIGPRSVAWVEDEVLEYQEKLIAARDARKAA